MDRRQWLTLIYREANRFVERHEDDGADLTPDRVEDIEPDLREQLQQALKDCDCLEDLVKHSLLKDPSPGLWQNEDSWDRVLAGVATECLVHDVKGIVLKILAGQLPRAASGDIRD